MKKVIGWTMLCTPFAVLLGILAYTLGAKEFFETVGFCVGIPEVIFIFLFIGGAMAEL